MFKYLLKFIVFRTNQLLRFCKELGLIRLLIAIPLFFIFLFFLVEVLSRIHPLAILILYIIPIGFFHLSRQDFIFLTHLKPDIRVLHAAEYNIATLPVSLVAASAGSYWIVPIGHLLLTLFVFVPAPKKFRKHANKDLAQWLPSDLFEWRTMFRKYFWTAIPSYTIGLLLSFHLFTLPLLVFYWSSLIAYTFSHIEPREFIEQYSVKSAFIIDKIKNHSAFLHTFFIPHYILFTIFNFEYVYILIPIILFLQTILLFCILFKYYHFNSSNRKIHNEIPMILFSLLTIFLFPVSITILYNYWRKITFPYHA